LLTLTIKKSKLDLKSTREEEVEKNQKKSQKEEETSGVAKLITTMRRPK
jgi:hypothetical protein